MMRYIWNLIISFIISPTLFMFPVLGGGGGCHVNEKKKWNSVDFGAEFA
jgi:hypothetical protein